MAKLNLNDNSDLDQLEEYGVKIKTRFKQRKMPKAKFNRKKESRKPQHRKNSLKDKYEE